MGKQKLGSERNHNPTSKARGALASSIPRLEQDAGEVAEKLNREAPDAVALFADHAGASELE